MSKTKTKPARSPQPSTIRYALVGLERSSLNAFGRSHTIWCATEADLVSAVEQATSNWTWICGDSEDAENLVSKVSVLKAKQHGNRNRLGGLLMLKAPRPRMLPALHGYFEDVIGETSSFTMLPIDQLAEVLNSDGKGELFIGGIVDEGSKTIALVRGNLDRLTIPLSYFQPSGKVRPDFRKLSIDDFGQTIAFGDYEAAADAILYEFDSEYRRKTNAQRRISDRNFGASLRRLRIQRGLSREQFSGIAAKTIARLERSEVGKPQGRTLSIIANTLKVHPEEIETY